MTVHDLFDRYLRKITPAKRSAQSETNRIKAIMRRSISAYSLANLSSTALAEYRDERLRTVAPATIVRELNTISHAIDIARKEWGVYLSENPVKLVRRPAVPRGRERRLQGDEEARLNSACGALRSPYMSDLITLAVETAMRRSELLGLTWGHVHFDRCIAHLPMTKNGESRDVPLSKRAQEVLRRLHKVATSERVFEVSGNAVRFYIKHTSRFRH